MTDTNDVRSTTVRLTPGPVSPEEVVAVARGGAAVALSEEALARIDRSRTVIEALAAAETPSYGVSTGFGALATRHIPTEQRAQLQRSLVRSHAAGSGPEVEREVVRALMLLRLSTLATGNTGVRREVAELLAGLLSHGITPVVREYGSLGCLGDLAPLSHCALALMGEGSVRDASGTLMPAERGACRCRSHAGRARRQGRPGADQRHRRHARHARAGAGRPADAARHRRHRRAMSVEGLLGTDRVFAAELAALRPHPGVAASAANLTRLLADSGIVASHRGPDCNRVQDAYSLRCAPQVHGAARDTITHAANVAGCELAASIDNPVVVGDRVESNGNFDGARSATCSTSSRSPQPTSPR